MLKGLEFDTIVLYKFGQSFCDKIYKEEKIARILSRDGDVNGKFHSLCQYLAEKQDESDFSFRVSYFFNKLYVAATRARKRLIIADTEEGIRDFWIPLQAAVKESVGERDDLTKREKDDSVDWKLAILDQGNSVKIFEDATKMADMGTAERDREMLTKALIAMKQGIENGNIDLLERTAIPFFKNAESSTGQYANEIKECEAFAKKFRKEWVLAGRLFEEIKKDELATECYWLEGSWKDVQRLYPAGSLQSLIAEFMEEKTLHFARLEEKTEELKELLSDAEIRWKQKLAFELSNYLTKQISILQDEDLKKLAGTISRLHIDSYNLGKAVAESFYKAGEYKTACKYWNEEHEGENPKYLHAKAESAESETGRIVSLINLRGLKTKLSKAQISIQEIETKIAELLQSFPPSVVEKPVREKIIGFLLDKGDAEKASTYLIATTNEPEIYRGLFAVFSKRIFSNELSQEIFLGSLLEKVQQNTFAENVRLVSSELMNEIYNSPFFRKLIRPKEGKLSLHRESLRVAEIILKLIAYSNLNPEVLVSKSFLKKELPSFSQLVLAVCEEELHSLHLPTYKQKISFEEMFGACERSTPFHKDVLAFLEKLLNQHKEHLPDSDYYFVKERWLKVKNKQISVIPNLKRQDELKQDLDRRMKEWNFGDLSKEEFPTVVKKRHKSDLADNADAYSGQTAPPIPMPLSDNEPSMEVKQKTELISEILQPETILHPTEQASFNKTAKDPQIAASPISDVKEKENGISLLEELEIENQLLKEENEKLKKNINELKDKLKENEDELFKVLKENWKLRNVE